MNCTIFSLDHKGKSNPSVPLKFTVLTMYYIDIQNKGRPCSNPVAGKSVTDCTV